jgi:hypothetical protein
VIKFALVVYLDDRSETLPSTRLPPTLAPYFHFLTSLTFTYSTPIGNLNETRAFHLERDRVSIPATLGVILTWIRVLEPPSHPLGVTFEGCEDMAPSRSRASGNDTDTSMADASEPVKQLQVDSMVSLLNQ